ncbi:MAG: hypothetical protein ABIP51_11785 [Bacteroidia bacterium]
MFLIEFTAEYYCQGYEIGTYQRLVYANSYEEACDKISKLTDEEWLYKTAIKFKNLTIF